jgi:galactokinase
MTHDVHQRACNAFQNHFASPPYWIASAPGRVNLIGEFTDYNDGFVLPMAIECRTAIAARPNGSNRIQLRSTTRGETVRIDLTQRLEPESKGRWSNYPKGVIAGFQQLGHVVPGFDAVVHSDVPMGAGLSSSAALEVACATLLERLCEVKLQPHAKVLLCQQAEHDYAQVPCGIMDPFITNLGRTDHVLLLDCRSQEPQWIPFSDRGVSILLFNTGIKHDLATSEYAKRRQECAAAAEALGTKSLREASLEMLTDCADVMDPVVLRRARHVVTENARVLQAAECMRARDWSELGQLLDASHESLRRDFEVSCKELDTVVEIARHIGRRGGVHGCRMTGGGFGGCVVLLVDAQRRQEIAETLVREYGHRTGKTATFLTSRAAQGAHLIEL